MDILLRDDKGFSHPVRLNVSGAEIPELIEQAREQQADLAERYGYKPEPIHCD